LAAAAALISSFSGKTVSGDCVVFGEISLSGDVRSVPHAESRLREAEKLGFKSAIVPKGTKTAGSGLQITAVANVAELADTICGEEGKVGTPTVAPIVVQSSSS
jgi:DNA repair protein RadA/Sms